MFSELGFIGTPLTTKRSTQYFEHLIVKQNESEG